MFDKILVANRGEIAKRVMDTCREMDIATVAVYSDVDREALHRFQATESVALGGSEAAESYLNMDKILDAARKTGAQAIHPGYGFLAENAEFSRRCEDEGLVFIGPSGSVIDKLGDKTVAREMMSRSGVPVIPGMSECSPDPDVFSQQAKQMGYPVLIKATGGGGGKGMRVVHSEEEMPAACRAASAEASAAFGNSNIYLEKYFQGPRHIEFQILADNHGNTIHLFERECSMQRRHQKIIEETPSTALTPELRQEMGEAAVTAARASGYTNAGTVEFLLDREGNFYFLEVNTRLQVEHPITEMTTGIDLVRQQIKIAAGEELGIRQEHVQPRGHAIECRIYAEDPEQNFLPSPGRIRYFKEPSGPGIRNDCGVYSGFSVPMEYDPIISKLVVFAEDRDKAIGKMCKALQEYVILGIKTPIPYLLDVLDLDMFRRGETYTDFLENEFADWKPQAKDVDSACLAYILDELVGQGSQVQAQGVAGESFLSPFETLGNWGR